MNEQPQEIAKTNGTPPAPAPVPPQEPTQPAQLIKGFEGMALAPFHDKALAVLAEPVDPGSVEVKPDGIVYLPGVWYTNRLNRAFGPGGWAVAPRTPARNIGQVVTYHGALYALGRFVSEAVGECEYHANNGGMSWASALEGARTDCRTRCCKDLGIAMELWDPTWREKWLSEFAMRAWGAGRDGKKKLFYWRKDREVPYQVNNAQAEPGRAKQGNLLALGPATGEHPDVGNDAGEPSPSSDLDDLEQLVFDDMKWKKDFAANWLMSHFGTNDPTRLTPQQIKSAFSMLHAFRKGPEPYAAEVERLRADRLVLQPKSKTP